MISGHYSPWTLRICALVGAAISAFALYAWTSFDGIPDRSRLQAATGPVASVERSRNRISFRLEGDAAWYEYRSSNGAMGVAESALAPGSRVTVAFDLGSARRDVLELVAQDHIVRSHAEVAASRLANARTGGVLGVVFAAMAICLVARARRDSRRDARFVRLPLRRQ